MIPNRRHNPRTSRRFRQPLKRFMQAAFRWLWWLTGNRQRSPQAGFVFPTTLLLVLMVLLTASALTFRSFSRSTQVIGQREQQVIYNAATPAIDRAKAKLEFLFTDDDRLIGVPSSDYLANMMLPEAPTNARIPGTVGFDMRPLTGIDDPYTLPDETRLDVNGDNKLDNAWAFPADVNGNGAIETGETATYSILVDHEAVEPGTTNTRTVSDRADDGKADALVTRTGPLGTTRAISACGSVAIVEEGWQAVDTSTSSDIQKNFQITAFVSNNRDDIGQSFESLEFQQSRIASTVNKWGAWFRYDLDIFPGVDFKWNGAMHTDGSLVVADEIISYMLTSHNSCLYSDTSSEITLGQFAYDDGVTFQGQAIKGSMKNNDYGGGDVEFHLFNGDANKPTLGTDLTNGNDSVDGGSPADVAMNPITLFLRDRAEHVDDSSWNRPAVWENSPFVTTGRIQNDPTSRPFVDDFFRADNRWGPKPRYENDDDDLSLEGDPGTTADDRNVGEPITAASTPKSNELIEIENGLDGYWERQAIKSGLRLIIGQRLELGNTNGWGYDPTTDTISTDSAADPLYPATAPISGTNIPGPHEYRQHRSLRDNLAAVQGMVVYHYDLPDANGDVFPAACMALTAHPGTEQSVINSRTFSYYPTGTNVLKADFLSGQGTNGWEFQFPTAFDSETKFAAELDKGDPLGDALRNLAYFSGDPSGGAPSFPPVQDANIHPFPNMSMWGDTSALRRIFDEYLDATTPVAYASLSFADKATLHSAACTMSLLAYNVDRSVGQSVAIAGEDLSGIGAELWALINSSNPTDISSLVGATYDAFAPTHPIYPGEDIVLTPNLDDRATWTDPNHTGTTGNTCVVPTDTDSDAFEVGCDESDYYSQFSSEDYIRAYVASQGLTAASTAADVAAVLNDVDKMRAFIEGNQISRDRALGFIRGPLPSTLNDRLGTLGQTDVGWSAADLQTTPTPTTPPTTSPLTSVVYASSCDPDVFNGTLAGTGAIDTNKVGLAAALCPNSQDTKYPSLYYLFPRLEHDHGGNDDTAGGGWNHAQPTTEEYVAAAYIATTNGNDESATAKRFEVLAPLEIQGIAAVPGLADASNWILPAAINAAGLTDPDAAAEAFRVQVPAGSGIDVPFLDKGIFNGREQMAVRVLDIDIDAITQNQTKPTGGDYWLPSKADDPSIDTDFATEGLIYAFREDAVREDEIVRPANASAPADCAGLTGTNDFKVVTEANCRMNVLPGTAIQDPPLQANNVSVKPVDFAPDPDRRAHGFRFRTLSGNPADFSGGDPATGRQNGMTFVSDNSAYIQGDFNLHTNNGQTTGFLEEFTYTLQNIADFDDEDFYDERTVANTNVDNFADLAIDHWRPVEVLTDALTVLSGTFPDGAAEDAFEAADVTDSSFASLNRPQNAGPWLREDPDDPTSPIWVDRNGTFYLDVSGTWTEYFTALTGAGDFITMGETNDRNENMPIAPDTYVNATFVGGIVPERPNESYGGLHNYPRFLENWIGNSLFISGSFIQLNFSTAATGPYDQEAWEPGTAPTTNEWFYHYQAPDRRWGFDVGLLYNPPAPAARRFSQLGRERSEYYRELPADDPYIQNLRCAEDSGNNQVFPNLCN
ncbi:MAG: hormogonium polysaccharide biosynthesis protein HpsA [Cyanobacteria bacterium P01_C01_bin.120]